MGLIFAYLSCVWAFAITSSVGKWQFGAFFAWISSLVYFACDNTAIADGGDWANIILWNIAGLAFSIFRRLRLVNDT